MVLLMANNSAVRTPPENLEEFLYSSQHLRREALAFRETKKKQMTDAEMQEKREFIRRIMRSSSALIHVRLRCISGVLFVNQHEFAVTHPGDPNVAVLGSEDATTCHIVTLRHSNSGVTCLAHVDLAEESNLDHMVDKMRQICERLSPPSPTEPTASAATSSSASAITSSSSSSTSSASLSSMASSTSGATASAAKSDFGTIEPLELCIVGGYEDEAERSLELTLELLEHLVNN